MIPVECRLCRSSQTEEVLRLEATPIHQHLMAVTEDDARGCPRGDVSLTFCRACGFVFNAAFDPRQLQYGPGYENSQEHSPVFLKYLDDLTTDLGQRYELSGKTVVEIGCGQGAFLERLTTATGCVGVGFDPSFDPDRGPRHPAATFIQARYTPAHRLASGAIACARHVIEHMESPRELMAVIRQAGDTVWIETPRLEWIVEHKAFWDIFYEHCSYFSMPLLAALAGGEGWTVTHHRSTFGAQYQWIEARPASTDSERVVSTWPETARQGVALRAFASSWARWRAAWRAALETLSLRGTCALWGAGAKSVAFLNQVDDTARTVHAVVDVNPYKQGRYVAGTGQPIVAPGALGELRPTTVLVANSNYLAEVGAIMRDIGCSAELITVEQPVAPL